ncbi:MAG: PorT family protein [Barnesiella sp.]|nr:PorT family protein [Bacteroidales bacterium]MBD5245450.1 PorT family protein [Barnesiella sp.]MBD5248650.1 PorT family protein [Barnesiella sp.]
MKKFLLSIILLLTLTGVEKASAQFRYGATAGVDLTTLNFKQDLISIDQSVGYQAGLQCEMMFPGIGFGIDFGLLYQQRGATLNLGEKLVWSSLGYGKERLYLHDVIIPIDLRFKWTRMDGFEDYLAPYVFGGPVIAFTVAHNNLDAMSNAGGNLGVQVGLGAEIFKKWQIQGSYMWGMTYSTKTKLLDDFSARDRVWSVRVIRYF